MRRFHSTPPKPGSCARASRQADAVVDTGGRALADRQPLLAAGTGHSGLHDLDPRVATEQQPQHAREVGLRLERDHAAAERRQRASAVAHVRPDVEHQRAGRRELAVETLHAALTPRNRVVNQQRSRQADDAVRPAHASV
jgi:hypothetical protein